MSDAQEYVYQWIHGGFVGTELLEELAALYSSQYGTWGLSSERPFQPIRLSARLIQRWLVHAESRLAYASSDGKIVGYAVAVQPKVAGLGVISWVTQLVVHVDHRRRDVGKRLLYSIWEFSDHFAWGLVTANPYAVRALEKATRRRCDPHCIVRHHERLLTLGETYVPYLHAGTECAVGNEESPINTEFFIDHTELPYMLKDVTKPDVPWPLGRIPEGWEWFAFTFRDHKEIGLSGTEIEAMMRTSDEVAKRAYSRMRLDASHRWAQYTPAEVQFIIRECKLAAGRTALDIGCGSGRHVFGLAKQGVLATGVDYLSEAIDERSAAAVGEPNAAFLLGDARDLNLGQTFDAVLCLYDVIGSFADEAENQRILRSIRRHLRSGGRALLSVMNLELTNGRARHLFSLQKEPNRLLDLPSSDTMEATGNVFNPDYYMIDEMTDIVYRKEQFTKGTELLSNSSSATVDIEGPRSSRCA